MSFLFGGAPKMPKVAKAENIQKIEPTDEETKVMMQQLVKRRRATMLNQSMSQPNIYRQSLGAATV